MTMTLQAISRFFSGTPLLTLAAILGVTHAEAQEVTMAFGEKIPPYCIPENDSGIELDIMREALAVRGHVLKPRYTSFARIPVMFENGTVDAAMTDAGKNLSAAGGHYAEPAIIYDNVLISLKQRALQIRQPTDLAGLSVLSFVGAANRYPDWLAQVKKQGRYSELNDQSRQVLMLSRSRVDLVLSDRYIFRYFSRHLQQSQGFTPPAVTEHQFVKLNPQDYRPIFRDPAIRDDFNVGLRQLKKSGRFDEIYRHYVGGMAKP
ncbi:MAG: transporter substrate-binding protein [Pseudomonadota bacterium]|jgi:polar amino acid transport system substrate-binding protein|nr:transporter substrate-binding protein [Pseudomonadota bacterium]